MANLVCITPNEYCSEAYLVKRACEQVVLPGEGEYRIYGGGVFTPCNAFGAFIGAVRSARFLGIAGLFIPEEAVVQWNADMRARIGAILQLAPQVWVSDDLSVEWALHYALKAKRGESLAWLAPTAQAELLAGDPVVHACVGDAIAHALVGKPFVLHAASRTGWGFTKNLGQPMAYHPLVRFARDHGLTERLCFSDEEVVTKLEQLEELGPIDPTIVTRAKSRATAMLEALLAAVSSELTPEEEVHAMLSGNAGTARRASFTAPWRTDGPRRLELGTVFDPATHYSAEYYDGRGLQYCAPDGSWQTYYGPSIEWEGNKVAVQILDRILPKGLERKALDVGCASGNWVWYARKAGWDARGVDLSRDAVNRAHPDVRDRIIISDVTQPTPELTEHAPYSIVLSLDVLEHVWEHQIEALLLGIRELMPVGGIFFNVVCTRGEAESDYIIRPGQTFTPQLSWLLASGHIHVRRWGYWMGLMIKCGFKPRLDLHALFQVARSEHPTFRATASWGPRNLVIVEKAA